MLLGDGILFSNRHEDELTQDTVRTIRQLHRSSGLRVVGCELSAGYLGVLEDRTEILDTNNDVKLVLHLNVVKLGHFHRNVGVKRLLEDSFLCRC